MATTLADVSVARGAHAEHVVTINEATAVRWSVAVANSLDVGLEIYFVDAARAGQVIKTSARIKEEEGVFVANAAGRLLFKFDNSFSMLRGKSVRVSTTLGANGFSAADVRDGDLMNDRVMRGIELFFTNKFSEAEQFFATEKDRVRGEADGDVRANLRVARLLGPAAYRRLVACLLDAPPSRRSRCMPCATQPCLSCARS